MSESIDEYLESIDSGARYRVLSVLKSSPHETTELVTPEDGISQGVRLIRKRISADAGIGWIYVRLFEEQLAGRLRGSVPRIRECYADESGLIVVMDCVDGMTLSDHVRQNGPIPEFARDVFPSICDAVTALHEDVDPPIIHRDLKPSNIMIDEDGAKIIDFGIARSYREKAESDTEHFGTRNYAPPEQFGFGQTDERSDVYALGRLLYFCLSAKNPEGTFTPAKLEKAGIGAPAAEVILKATSFDPANRYQNVREFKRAVEGVLHSPRQKIASTSQQIDAAHSVDPSRLSTDAGGDDASHRGTIAERNISSGMQKNNYPPRTQANSQSPRTQVNSHSHRT